MRSEHTSWAATTALTPFQNEDPILRHSTVAFRTSSLTVSNCPRSASSASFPDPCPCSCSGWTSPQLYPFDSARERETKQPRPQEPRPELWQPCFATSTHGSKALALPGDRNHNSNCCNKFGTERCLTSTRNTPCSKMGNTLAKLTLVVAVAVEKCLIVANKLFPTALVPWHARRSLHVRLQEDEERHEEHVMFSPDGTDNVVNICTTKRFTMTFSS